MKDLWQELQDLEWAEYLKSPVGTFSVDGLRGAEMTGHVINDTIPGGRCLDVGCGVLPFPSYMKAAPDVCFMGIDPYTEKVKREFKFFRGYAENLPWATEVFDGVLFATSLDHVKDPSVALKESYRVLSKGGYLFIWCSVRKNDKKYQQWLKAPKPARYDTFHMWAYTEKSLMELAKDFNFVERIIVKGNESIFIFRK